MPLLEVIPPKPQTKPLSGAVTAAVDDDVELYRQMINAPSKAYVYEAMAVDVMRRDKDFAKFKERMSAGSEAVVGEGSESKPASGSRLKSGTKSKSESVPDSGAGLVPGPGSVTGKPNGRGSEVASAAHNPNA